MRERRNGKERRSEGKFGDGKLGARIIFPKMSQKREGTKGQTTNHTHLSRRAVFGGSSFCFWLLVVWGATLVLSARGRGKKEQRSQAQDRAGKGEGSRWGRRGEESDRRGGATKAQKEGSDKATTKATTKTTATKQRAGAQAKSGRNGW